MFSCFSWIPALFNQSILFTRNSMNPPKPLPDEIIIDILSRLTAEDVHNRCRKVCKRWKSLTSTKTFIDLHLQRSVPTVIVQQEIGYCNKTMDLFLLDDWKERKNRKHDHDKDQSRVDKRSCVRSIPIVKQYKYPQLYLSYHGLLLFSEFMQSGPRFFVVFNPVTQEKLEIITPHGTIIGIFRHPVSKKYYAIWHGFIKNMYQYKIFSLESKGPWRGLGRFPYISSTESPPVVVKTRIAEDGKSTVNPHCRESIMVFETKREIFLVIPHPGSECERTGRGDQHNRMHLIEIDGKLAFSKCWGGGPFLMDIWVLEDHKDYGSWIRRHKLMMIRVLDVDRLDMHIPWSGPYIIRPLGIQKGQLLLASYSGGQLFVVSLETGNVVRKLHRKEASSSSMRVHSSSLVGLSC